MLRCRMCHRWMLGFSINVWFHLVYSISFHPAASERLDAVVEDFPASSLIYVPIIFRSSERTIRGILPLRSTTIEAETATPIKRSTFWCCTTNDTDG
jgi:hypothetical protein